MSLSFSAVQSESSGYGPLSSSSIGCSSESFQGFEESLALASEESTSGEAGRCSPRTADRVGDWSYDSTAREIRTDEFTGHWEDQVGLQ